MLLGVPRSPLACDPPPGAVALFRYNERAPRLGELPIVTEARRRPTPSWNKTLGLSVPYTRPNGDERRIGGRALPALCRHSGRRSCRMILGRECLFIESIKLQDVALASFCSCFWSGVCSCLAVIHPLRALFHPLILLRPLMLMWISSLQPRYQCLAPACLLSKKEVQVVCDFN